MKPRITEEQWLAAGTLTKLDLYRTAWKQFRKWRLFGAACCRRAMALAPDVRLDGVVEAAERFAESSLTWDDMKRVRRVLTQVRKELGDEFGPDEAKHDILDALDHVTQQNPVGSLGADQKAQFAFAAVSRPKFNTGARRAEKEQVELARDIFGNPFRPVAFDPAWRTDTVLPLARVMYETRDFAAMPILADALQDAGCEHPDILDHCRAPDATHVRGCWVVDLVLVK